MSNLDEPNPGRWSTTPLRNMYNDETICAGVAPSKLCPNCLRNREGDAKNKFIVPPALSEKTCKCFMYRTPVTVRPIRPAKEDEL